METTRELKVGDRILAYCIRSEEISDMVAERVHRDRLAFYCSGCGWYQVCDGCDVPFEPSRLIGRKKHGELPCVHCDREDGTP